MDGFDPSREPVRLGQAGVEFGGRQRSLASLFDEAERRVAARDAEQPLPLFGLEVAK